MTLEESATLKTAMGWFVDVEESAFGRKSSISRHRFCGLMLLAYGFDGEKLREFSS